MEMRNCKEVDLFSNCPRFYVKYRKYKIIFLFLFIIIVIIGQQLAQS